MTDVAPPAVDEWWDTAATKAAVLHQLRLQVGDVDEARVAALIPTAGRLINTYLDRVDTYAVGDQPDTLQPALEQVVIELYRSKDSPGATSTDWSSTQGTYRYGAVDPIAEVMYQIIGEKRRWGVG